MKMGIGDWGLGIGDWGLGIKGRNAKRCAERFQVDFIEKSREVVCRT